MTVAAVSPLAEAAPPARAALARVAELQAMIARAQRVEAPSNGGASFPAALASAAAGAPGQPLAAAAAVAVPAPFAPAAQASPYDGLIAAAAQRHGIDPALLHGLVRAESNFNPNAVSSAGAQGLCQLMPGTAAALGVTDPFDPAQSLDGGARYLRQQLDAFGGDPTLALAAYNAGPGAVRRHGGVPPYAETQAYVRKVLAYADEYRASVGALAPAGYAGAHPAAAFAPPYAFGAPPHVGYTASATGVPAQSSNPPYKIT